MSETAKVQINFQPTLLVFIGTSAGQIGWRVKKLLRQSYGEVPVLRFLWVDIDSSIDSLARPWFTPSERAELFGFNPAVVVQNLDHYPHIQAWWPQINVPAGVLDGSGGSPMQMRLVGRLALFRMFNDRERSAAFIDKLRSATEEMLKIANHEATTAKSNEERAFTVSPGCRVVLMFSPCGGTGSSMAFDVAYLCRKLLAGQSPHIVSISVLPPVIDASIHSETQAQKEKIRANAYAWFKEDNYLTENPYWDVTYPEGGPVRIPAAPFNIRFLVDIQNQAGYRLDSADDVYNMIAQAIFMDTGSSIVGSMRGFTANVQALSEEFEGMRQSYSSLGAASLIYPKERLLNYCAHRFSEALIRDALLAQPDSHEVEVAASTLLSHLHLRDADLLGDLMGVSQMKMIYESSIAKADHVAAAVTQVDGQESLNQGMRRSEAEKVTAFAEKHLEELKQKIDQEVTHVTATSGLAFAQSVLDLLLTSAPSGEVDAATAALDGFKTRIQQQGYSDRDLKEAQERLAHARKALKTLDDGWEDVLERVVNMQGWRRRFALYKTDTVNAMKSINEITLQITAQQQAGAIYDQLASHLKDLKSVLAASISNLETLQKAMAAEGEKLASKTEDQSGRYEFLQEIEIDFSNYYAENSASLRPQASFSRLFPAQVLMNMKELAGWLEEEGHKAILSFAQAFFAARIEKTSLLETLEEIAHQKGIDPKELVEQHLDRLVNYCYPFWSYETNRGLASTEGKSIIGIENENSPLIPDAYRSSNLYELKSTGFRDRIDVLRMRHGVPAFLLNGMEEWRSLYEERRKGIDPLHVLPGMDTAPDMLPDQNRKGREMFARAIAFGYIGQVGTYYYVDLNKSYLNDNINPSKEYRLGRGRVNAEEAFTRRIEWAGQVEDCIEDEIRQMGNQAAIQKLDGVIDGYKAEIAKMRSPDETLRKQFEKEIQSLRTLQRELGKIS